MHVDRSVFLALLLLAPAARAQEPQSSDTTASDLAKTSQNPISDLISIPFQFNFNSGSAALGDQSSMLLNVQPVLPMHLTPRWNLIARTILPVLSVPSGTGRATGVGDILEELFFSPADSTELVWGVGPIASVPTATLGAATTGSWAAGPAAVVVWMPGSWVVGGLGTALWTFADYGDDREVNNYFAQGFANYNLGGGWALSSAPQLLVDRGSVGTQTTLALGGGISLTSRIGSQPMTVSAQYYRNVERPDGATPNQLRISIAFLFPSAPKPAPGPAATAAAATPGCGETAFAPSDGAR